MIAAALHIGINKYPAGNALQCCVADAKTMARLFGGKLLLDKQATRKHIMQAVNETVRIPKEGEWAVITYSGHGTQMADMSGDESDGFDEALVDVRLDVIVDDEFQDMLRGRNRGARILVISDSCYSGTIHRAAPLFSRSHLPALRRNGARYLPRSVVKPQQSVVNAGPQKPLPNVVLVSGCADFELSYEGANLGILTHAVKSTSRHWTTIGQAAKKVADEVGLSGYPQTPQLTCSKAAMKWPVPRKAA